MPKKKGDPKTGGRKKGTPNKVTTTVKEALMESFQGLGGKTYLDTLSKTEPRAYATLLGKLIPTEVKAELEHSGGLEVNVVTGIPRAPKGDPDENS